MNHGSTSDRELGLEHSALQRTYEYEQGGVACK